MRYAVIGFALLALAKALEVWAEAGSPGPGRVPANLLALLVLIVAGLFFVRAIVARIRR